MEQNYRVLIQVRVRGQSTAESTEIKTEYCDDMDNLLLTAVSFIEETINDLEDGGNDG